MGPRISGHRPGKRRTPSVRGQRASLNSVFPPRPPPPPAPNPRPPEAPEAPAGFSRGESAAQGPRQNGPSQEPGHLVWLKHLAMLLPCSRTRDGVERGAGEGGGAPLRGADAESVGGLLRGAGCGWGVGGFRTRGRGGPARGRSRYPRPVDRGSLPSRLRYKTPALMGAAPTAASSACDPRLGGVFAPAQDAAAAGAPGPRRLPALGPRR